MVPDLCVGFCGLLACPLLVATAVAGPDIHPGAVGRACTNHVEAEAGLAADDRAVGVEGPQLVRASVAVPDLHLGACRRGMAWHVEALVTIDLQLSVRQGGPLLVRATIAVPDIQQGAVGRDRPWNIQATVRTRSPQNPGRPATATTTATTVVREAPAVLESVEAGLVRDAQREIGATAIERRDRTGFILAGARAIGLGGLLDTRPQDRTHAETAHGIGDPIQVRQVVVAILGAIVVDTGVHRDTKLSQDRTAGVATESIFEVSDPACFGGVRVAEHAIDVDRQEGPAQA